MNCCVGRGLSADSAFTLCYNDAADESGVGLGVTVERAAEIARRGGYDVPLEGRAGEGAESAEIGFLLRFRMRPPA